MKIIRQFFCWTKCGSSFCRYYVNAVWNAFWLESVKEWIAIRQSSFFANLAKIPYIRQNHSIFPPNFFGKITTYTIYTSHQDKTMHPTEKLISINLFKILSVWHGHDYIWPPWLWKLLEAKNVIVSAHFCTLTHHLIYPTFLLTKRNKKSSKCLPINEISYDF